MKCPYCGENLIMYEAWEDYSEYSDDILKWKNIGYVMNVMKPLIVM